ncbi:anthranilate synthase alpha subunit 1, chloroplastic-like [Euphorbia lathyris]|uniref:anthranilate synthase alpha subunit 1, chloroplastic-like n=1 Tax=Euphorbia lathyris TaxID=212925 RepID=UPI0033144BB8
MAFSLLTATAGSRSYVSSVRPLKCVSLLDFSAVPDPSDFAKAAKRGNVVPLHSCIFSDQLTPVIAYRCLVKEDDRETPSFLFESVEPGSKVSTVGRYSVVGANPSIEIVARENKVSIMDHEVGTLTEEFVEDPMVIARRISEGWKPQIVCDLPDAFCGGWVGYFSYDTVRYIENDNLPFSRAPKDDTNLPDIHFGLYDDIIVFDHVHKKVHVIHWVIHWVMMDRYTSIEYAYSDGIHQLQKLVARLQNIDPHKLSRAIVQFETRNFSPTLTDSNMTREEYMELVSKAKKHIVSRDISRVFLSQCFERRTFANPLQVYRALRVVNPNRYMSYLQARGCILVTSSPHILTRVNKNKIINKPLSGTMRRGRTTEEDEMLEMKLRNDPKQYEEHSILVDSGLNDIGKVAKPGSLAVDNLMNIERYSHVMHLSSTITGELRNGLSYWDALRAALPLGTVCGDPKVKAMELIDKLEVTRRGPYGGGFGSVSFTGELDMALSIQTMVFTARSRFDRMYSYEDVNKQRGEWIAHIQTGQSIVADSDLDYKHWECENKAIDLARAIDLAEQLFPNFGVLKRELERYLSYN